MNKYLKWSFLVSLMIFVVACAANKGEGKSKKGFNLFTIEQDKELGAKVAWEIDSNKREYPQLDSAKNVEVYKYLYAIRNKILNSGQVTLKDKFQWRLRVVHNDSVLNAFCTPGGYIYIYTGILKYLDSEDQLAGVLGHEIAHADLRHSTRQMTTMFGVQVMLEIIAGNRNMLKQVTGAVVGLKFSRKHESEADESSVKYLCPTDYNAAGGAGFFQKLNAAGGVRPPEFLSTHPNPENRIENFINSKTTNGCKGEKTYTEEYKKMLLLLPK
jgi:beta-barrel assembly-enhancing protease